MPNHVEGLIQIYGSEADLKELMEFVKEGESLLSANKIIPYPEKFKKMDEEHYEKYGTRGSQTPEQKARFEQDTKDGTYLKDGYNSGGYEWCCDNWGTKWGFYNISVSEMFQCPYNEDGEFLVEYNVNTAWSPAIPVIEALSLKFPNVVIKYWFEDEGWCYPAGCITVKHGIIITEQTWNDIDAWKQMEIFEDYDQWKAREEEYERESASYNIE